MKMLTLKLLVFSLWVAAFKARPVQDLFYLTRDQVVHSEFLPPDHVPGGHREHDGDINKDYHHEAFLGALAKEGKIRFDQLEGYYMLIDIFHKADTNQDHELSEKELENWIHQKIVWHHQASVNGSVAVFHKVDSGKDGHVSWPEYKAQLFGLDPFLYKDVKVNMTLEEVGPFAKEALRWTEADYNKDGFLEAEEFTAFMHPEQDKHLIEVMADEMLHAYDRDGDGFISMEEYIRLPGGEVTDAEGKEMDRLYQESLRQEFREHMDADQNDAVTKSELVSYLDPLNMRHALKEAQYLLRLADRDRNSAISENEMLLNYKLFTGSTFTHVKSREEL